MGRKLLFRLKHFILSLLPFATHFLILPGKSGSFPISKCIQFEQPAVVGTRGGGGSWGRGHMWALTAKLKQLGANNPRLIWVSVCFWRALKQGFWRKTQTHHASFGIHPLWLSNNDIKARRRASIVQTQLWFERERNQPRLPSVLQTGLTSAETCCASCCCPSSSSRSPCAWARPSSTPADGPTARGPLTPHLPSWPTAISIGPASWDSRISTICRIGAAIVGWSGKFHRKNNRNIQLYF